MTENGAYRIDLFYSTALNKYKVLPTQYRTGTLLTRREFETCTEKLSDYLVYKTYDSNNFRVLFPKTFKSKKRALRYMRRSIKKADKFLTQSLPDSGWEIRFAYTHTSSNRKWKLDYDECVKISERLEENNEL